MTGSTRRIAKPNSSGISRFAPAFAGFCGSCRPIAQLAEQRSPKPQVGGSSPSWPAKLLSFQPSALNLHDGNGRGRMRAESCQHFGVSMDQDKNNNSVIARPREWWMSTREFFRDTNSEMKKVTWPSRPEVVGTTVVVIVSTLVFAIFLWG